MLSCFHPKHLALAGLFLTSVVQAADAPVAPAPEAASSFSTIQANFSLPYSDPYTRNNWMVVQVDFVAKAPSGVRWINEVDVALTMGWGTRGTTPQVDLASTSTVHLVAVEVGKRSSVFFFVPPEVLTQGAHGQSYEAGRAPTFYVIQYNGAAPGKTDYSTQTLPDDKYIAGFLKLAAEKSVRSVLMSEANVPSYILANVIGRINTTGTGFPTFVTVNDSGH